MKNLFKFYLIYLFYFASFWGFVTFTYDLSSNKFVSSKRLNVWNRFITFIVFFSIVKTTQFSIAYLSSVEFLSFQRICFMCMDILTTLTLFYILVITSFSEKFIKLANSSRKLLDSIVLSNNAKTEISKSFTFTFINDLAAYATVVYLIRRTIKEQNESDIYLVSLNFILWKGFKHMYFSRSIHSK